MENAHEWTNVMKYVTKWKLSTFQKEFIERMKLRLNEVGPTD